MQDIFRKVAHRIACWIGTPWAFALALLGVIGWLVTGPLFGYSDTWQLVINTATTVVTFLVVFLIQNTQNHDARAMHLKLDELVRAVEHARSKFLDLETLSDAELDRIEREFARLRRRPDPGAPARRSQSQKA